MMDVAGIKCALDAWWMKHRECCSCQSKVFLVMQLSVECKFISYSDSPFVCTDLYLCLTLTVLPVIISDRLYVIIKLQLHVQHWVDVRLLLLKRRVKRSLLRKGCLQNGLAFEQTEHGNRLSAVARISTGCQRNKYKSPTTPAGTRLCRFHSVMANQKSLLKPFQSFRSGIIVIILSLLFSSVKLWFNTFVCPTF